MMIMIIKNFDESEEVDLAVRNLHIKNGDLMVAAAYARKGEFEEKLSQMARLSRKGEVPFILLMDANVPT